MRPRAIRRRGWAALIAGTVVIAPAAAMAADCLAAPNGAAAPGQHWNYRLERTNGQKCWYLKSATTPASSAPVPSEPTAPRAAAPSPIPAAQPLPATQPPAAGIPPTAAEREALFHEFLDWQKRRSN